MKTLSVFLCLTLISSVKVVVGDKKSAAANLMDCKIEVGATDDDVKALVRKTLPNSHSGLCLLCCLYEKAGVIKDGKFVVENLSQAVDSGDFHIGGKMASQYMDNVIYDCKDVKNDDKCILAKEIIVCAAESITRHANMNNKEL